MAKYDIFETESALSDCLCETISSMASAKQSSGERFVLGVSGGSVATILCDGLASLVHDWRHWTMLFCDERHVSRDDKECTFAVYRERLLERAVKTYSVGGPVGDRMVVLATDPQLPLAAAADDYERQIAQLIGAPEQIDLLVLGIGPDGHTCSLFPGDEANLALDNGRVVTYVTASPKPPPERVTLSLAAVVRAQTVFFVSVGEPKAPILARIQAGDRSLPAARVLPHSGRLRFFVDRPAARLLTF